MLVNNTNRVRFSPKEQSVIASTFRWVIRKINEKDLVASDEEMARYNRILQELGA